MMKIGMFKKTEIFFSKNVVLFKVIDSKIIIGKNFTILDKDTQNFILNNCMAIIKYKKTHDTSNLEEIQIHKNVDQLLYQEQYTYEEMIKFLKEMHKIIQKNYKEFHDKENCSFEMKLISERYVSFKKYYEEIS